MEAMTGEREAFEAAVRQWPNYSERTLARDGRYHEYYGSPVVQGAWEGWKARAHLAQPAQAVDVERALAALGHVREPNTRCTARVAETPPQLRPPGPQNPPMYCCLTEGHDGPHRHNGGGMYPSIPFRDTDDVVMVPLPDTCEKCRRIWPCDDAKALTRALSGEKAGTVGDGWVFRWHTEGDDSLLLISHPEHGGVGVHKEPTSPRMIPEEMLYLLARDLIPASPTPDKEG